MTFKNFMNLQLFADPNPVQGSGHADLAVEQKTWYHRNLMERLRGSLVYSQFAQKVKIPKGNSKTVEFRRFSSLDVNAVGPGVGYTNNQFQLTEGVTPAGQTMKATAFTATVSQHGSYIAITDVLELTNYDPILDQASELLGEQAGDYIDLLVREVLMAGTNVLYAFASKFNTDGEAVRDTAAATPTARVQVGTSHPLSWDTLRAGKRIMQRNKVKPYKGEKSTKPGAGEYVCIIHPDAVFDIESTKKWNAVKTYQDQADLYSGELGMGFGVRIVVTENAKVWAAAGLAGADVYGALMIGNHAYGIVDVAGSGNVEYIFHPKGSAGSGDALNQRSTTGWKCMFTTVILEQLALLRIEHGFRG